MDTSENYIDMCEKAVAVQELWIQAKNSHCAINRKHGDIVSLKYNGKKPTIYTLLNESHAVVFKFSMDDGTTFYSQYSFDDLIWLPRQDQLQEMLSQSGVHIAFRFGLFLEDGYLPGSLQKAFVQLNNLLNGASMEQLWLAFVMKEELDKVWNGDDWELVVQPDHQ